MPAWIAGIQVRRMRPGDIHVNLNSSSLCWGGRDPGFRVHCPRPAVFIKEAAKSTKFKSINSESFMSLVCSF
jgi:hypothetical protein